MLLLDYFVIVCYLALLIYVGVILSKQVKSTDDMFSAGKNIPWWYAGISSYMTLFSAGTFVIWGGIAYRMGMVGLMICLVYSLSAFIVAYTVSKRWRSGCYSSPAEFIELRFGKTALQIYTWAISLNRVIGVALSIYSVAVIISALIPIEGFFANAEGNFSVGWAVFIFGIVIVAYTLVGGLWAVVLTDVLQFIILTTTILIILPLIWIKAGGYTEIMNNIPEGFLSPVAGEFTWLFLVGWMVNNAIHIAGSWEFVQRNLTVPEPEDAKKANILFGILYFITPFFWMLPPMIFRSIVDGVPAESAYITAVKYVLPPGLMGLMVAAMFSATASMADSVINVFAGAVTRSIYGTSDEKKNFRVGQICTIVYGGLVILLGVCVPYLGGAEKIVLTAVNLVVGPLLLPTIWGLLSSRIGFRDLMIILGIGMVSSIILKFGISAEGFLRGIPIFDTLGILAAKNGRIAEMVSGTVIPIIILSIMELRAKHINYIDKGWLRDQEFGQKQRLIESKLPKSTNMQNEKYSLLGTFLIGIALVVVLSGIIATDNKLLIILYGVALSLIGLLLYRLGVKKEKVHAHTNS